MFRTSTFVYSLSMSLIVCRKRRDSVCAPESFTLAIFFALWDHETRGPIACGAQVGTVNKLVLQFASMLWVAASVTPSAFPSGTGIPLFGSPIPGTSGTSTRQIVRMESATGLLVGRPHLGAITMITAYAPGCGHSDIVILEKAAEAIARCSRLLPPPVCGKTSSMPPCFCATRLLASALQSCRREQVGRISPTEHSSARFEQARPLGVPFARRLDRRFWSHSITRGRCERYGAFRIAEILDNRSSHSNWPGCLASRRPSRPPR